MKPFDYYEAHSVEEALRRMAALRGTRVRLLAGGTDLIVQMKDGVDVPDAVIHIGGIEELRRIEDEGDTLRIGAGVAFIAFAIYTLVFEKDEKPEISDRSLTVASSFSLVALMELGDKTQLACISLAAEYEAPVLVFAGVMLAFVVLVGLGVILGVAISRYVPLRYVRIGSGLLFIMFGVMFIWSAASGVKLF